MSKLSVPAVIVGFERNGLGVARSLRREGISSISLTGTSWTPSCASRMSKTIRSPDWSEQAVISELLTIGRRLKEKAPLLITKDEPVLWISAHRALLGEFFRITLPEPDVVLRLMDKTRFQARAIAQGWPVPRSWSAPDRLTLVGMLNDITYPCILKPAVKNSKFRRQTLRKAFRISTAQQLLDTYDLISGWEPEVIVQEWIAGGDDRVGFVLGYWNPRSQALASFAGRKIRQWPPECGNTAFSEPAPTEWREELVSLTQDIYKTVGFRGLGSIEYKMSPQGRPVIMEPTVGRTNYQSELAVVNGVNLPAIAYFDAMGMAPDVARLVDASHQRRRTTKLIDLASEFRSARFYCAASRLSWRSWLHSRRGRTYDMLYRLNDPAPSVLAVSRRLASFAKHSILKPLVRPLLPFR